MSTQDGDKRVIRRSKRISILDNDSSITKIPKIELPADIVENLNKSDDTIESTPFIGVCESCSTNLNEQNSLGESARMCNDCIETEKVKCDEYSENKSKSCEHCKATTLSEEHKMIGCLICSKYYHINCLLPGDVPSNLVFESGQFIRRLLGCVRCAVVHLCYKVRDVVTWRWRSQARNVEDPGKYFVPREFLIHYAFLSHWDCEWVTELQFEMSEVNAYRSYRRRTDLAVPPSPSVLSDGHRRKMSEMEIELHEKYVKWGIEAEWLQPHRVLSVDEVGCTVKWRGLGYNNLSTEPLTRVKEIPGLQEAIKRYTSLEKELLDDSDSPVDKGKLTKLLKSPDYLGSVENSDKPSLYPYQLDGVNWLRSSYSNDVNTILADEMGLGKTIQAITFLYSLYKDNVSKGPFFVVVPLTTLKNWEREFEYWAPDFTVLPYYGDKDCRTEIRNYLYFTSKKKKVLSFHVLLTTYELIYFDDTFLHPIKWEILIIDEAHRLKNNESKLFKTFKKYKIKFRNLMTGTPLQNNLEELFHLLNFMEPQSFGNLTEFLAQFQDVSKEEQVRTLQEMLKKHILRRLKADVMSNLPIKEEQIVRLDLTNIQKDLYKMILTKNYEYLGGRFSSARMTNIMMHLRKVCNHPYLVMSKDESQMRVDGGYDVPALVAASGKMELLQKMLLKLKAAGHRVLLFSGMTKLLDIMEYMLDDLGTQYERIDGSVAAASRQSAIDRFNNPDSASMIFLLSTRAGGLGINLSSADTVIIYDADWNPHNDIQALSRAHRIGQQNKVMIYRFVTRNSVEEKIMETAKRKMMVTNLVVKNCTKSEFHQILSFGTKELFDESAADDQKIIYDDAAICALLDRDRTEVALGEGNLLETCFSGFKVADCQYATEAEALPAATAATPEERVRVPAEVVNVLNPEGYWVALLAPLVRQRVQEELLKEPELGKGLRLKKKVFFGEPCPQHALHDDDDGGGAVSEGSDHGAAVDKEVVDTDFDASEEEAQEPESSSSEHLSDGADGDFETVRDLEEAGEAILLESSNNTAAAAGSSSGNLLRYGLDRDWRRLVSYGIDGDAARNIGLSGADRRWDRFNRFSVVDGFLPVERMDLYSALMNYGLPPKVLRKSDLWWPSSLQHKSIDEMCRCLRTIMAGVVGAAEPHRTQEAGLHRDDIDHDLLLARIGLNALIGHKVNEFETRNRAVLEVLLYKRCDVHAQTVEEVKEVFAELTGTEFQFDIYEGGFSMVRALWSASEGAGAGAGAGEGAEEGEDVVGAWGRMHDYMLLSAMALYGYDRYLDLVFQDPQFQVLLVPAKVRGLDMMINNFEVRKMIRGRQAVLENALLIESQLSKVCAVLDDTGDKPFSPDTLLRYHRMFSSQTDAHFVTKDLFNNRSKLKGISALAQLEVLINDIESEATTFVPIEVRKEGN